MDENQDKMKCDTKDAQDPGEGKGDRNEFEELRLKAEENWQLFLKAGRRWRTTGVAQNETWGA